VEGKRATVGFTKPPAVVECEERNGLENQDEELLGTNADFRDAAYVASTQAFR
jgi:hypothetical protein